MGPVAALFGLMLRQMVWSPKIIFPLLLSLIPGALALVVRYAAEVHHADRHMWEFYHGVTQMLTLQIVVPVLCMLYGTALVGAEVESRTFVYLTSRRMRRGTVLLVKYVAAALVLVALTEWLFLFFHACHLGARDPVLLPRVAGAAWRPMNDLVSLLVAAPVSVLAYLAVFTLFGLLSARPLVVSIVYLLGAEVFLGNMPFEVRAYSVLHLTRKILAGRVAGLEEFYPLTEELWDKVYVGGIPVWCGALLVVSVALALAVVLVTKRELLPSRMARE